MDDKGTRFERGVGFGYPRLIQVMDWIERLDLDTQIEGNCLAMRLHISTGIAALEAILEEGYTV